MLSKQKMSSTVNQIQICFLLFWIMITHWHSGEMWSRKTWSFSIFRFSLPIWKYFSSDVGAQIWQAVPERVEREDEDDDNLYSSDEEGEVYSSPSKGSAQFTKPKQVPLSWFYDMHPFQVINCHSWCIATLKDCTCDLCFSWRFESLLPFQNYLLQLSIIVWQTTNFYLKYSNMQSKLYVFVEMHNYMQGHIISYATRGTSIVENKTHFSAKNQNFKKLHTSAQSGF